MADNKRIVYTIEVNDKGKVKIDNLTSGFTNANIAVNKLNADLLTQGEIMENNSKKNQNMIDHKLLNLILKDQQMLCDVLRKDKKNIDSNSLTYVYGSRNLFYETFTHVHF